MKDEEFMRIIKNLLDINRIQRNKVLGSGFSNHLKEYLRYLLEELDSIEPGAYKAEDTGFVVILENGDDVRDLSAVGLNPKD